MIREKMAKKFKDKGEEISPELFDEVTHEVSTAAMKHALLSVSCQTQINFDIAKITDFEDASAPFILYNSTRVASVVRKFNDKVEKGQVPVLPPLDPVDCALLDDGKEWEILMEFVLPFASMIVDGAMPKLGAPRAALVRHAQGLRLPQRHGARPVGVLWPRGCAHSAHGQSAGGGVKRRRRDARAYPPVQGVQAGHRQRPQTAHDRAPGAHVGSDFLGVGALGTENHLNNENCQSFPRLSTVETGAKEECVRSRSLRLEERKASSAARLSPPERAHASIVAFGRSGAMMTYMSKADAPSIAPTQPERIRGRPRRFGSGTHEGTERRPARGARQAPSLPRACEVLSRPSK